MEMEKPGAANLQASNLNNFFLYSNQIFYSHSLLVKVSDSQSRGLNLGSKVNLGLHPSQVD